MTDSLMPWYREYGIGTDPFRNQPDVFYPGAQRRERLDLLHHLCHFSNLVLLLLGNKGIGKSRLVEQLLLEEGDSLHPVLIRPDLLMGAERLLRQIASQLGLSDAENVPPEKLLGVVDEHLRQNAGEGLRVLLVVEDAQSLPEDSLALLLTRFQPWVEQGLFSMLLLADPDFLSECARWTSRLERSGWFHAVMLEPLTQPEAREYLEQRMKAAGWGGSPAIPEESIRKLYAQSHGNPALLHRLAPALLQSTVPPPRSKSDAHSGHFWKSSWPWVALASVLLLGSFLLVALQYQKEQDAVPPVVSAESQPDLKIQMDEDPVLMDLSQLLDQAESRLQEEMGKEEVVEPGIPDETVNPPGAAQPEESVKAPESREQTTPDPVPEEPSLADDRVISEPETSSRQSEATAEGGESAVTSAGDGGSVPADPLPERALPQQTESSSQAKAGVEHDVPEQPQGPDEKASGSAENVTKPPVPQADSLHPAYRSSRWLMQQSPERYTVQFLASYNEETAQTFIDDLSDRNGYLYVRTIRNGRDWFVVLHGNYPSRAAAREAVSRLPPPLKKLGPWVRQMREIQQDARAGN